jgi:hypothetical protein
MSYEISFEEAPDLVKKQNCQDPVSSLELASLNNFGGF